MKDLISTIQIIIIVVAFVIGIAFIGYLAWSATEISRENTKERYFQCLERTEKLTCDKIFYHYKTKKDK